MIKGFLICFYEFQLKITSEISQSIQQERCDIKYNNMPSSQPIFTSTNKFHRIPLSYKEASRIAKLIPYIWMSFETLVTFNKKEK